MKRILSHRPSPATVISLFALVVALGGVAYATIPDSSGTIHACYQKSNGALRVVDSGVDCRSSEMAISWNQQGAPPLGQGAARTVPRTVVDAGQSSVLVQDAPFTLRGHCRIGESDNPPGGDRADIVISSSEPEAVWNSSRIFFFGAGFTNEENLIVSEGGDPNEPRGQGHYFGAHAPGGTSLSGNLFAGVNLPADDECVFGGQVTVTRTS